jgi:hypothetical protein
MERGFCGACGTPLVIRRPETPLIAFVQVGSLDDPSVFVAETNVFVKHARKTRQTHIPEFEGPPSAEFVKPRMEAYFSDRS